MFQSKAGGPFSPYPPETTTQLQTNTESIQVNLYDWWQWLQDDWMMFVVVIYDYNANHEEIMAIGDDKDEYAK